tara:strand:+ start:199 stop:612 length:414 start_codon:yes stop_codon:yes gene_type:complete
MIKSLSHISISSNNLNKVIDYYIKVLDFKIAHKFINKSSFLYGVFIYCGNKTFIEFFFEKKKIKKINKLRHICFEVSNIKKIAKKLKKIDPNIKLRRGKTDKVLQFMTKDFENNLIEFHEHDKLSKIRKFFYAKKTL